MDEINPIKGEVASTVGYLPWKEERPYILCEERDVCEKTYRGRSEIYR